MTQDKSTLTETIVSALVILANHGIPTDVQELLLYGNGRARPGALHAVLRDAVNSHAAMQECVEAGTRLVAAHDEAGRHGISVPKHFWDDLRSALLKLEKANG